MAAKPMLNPKPKSVAEVLDAMPPSDKAEFLQWAQEEAKRDGDLDMLTALRAYHKANPLPPTSTPKPP